MEKEILKKLEEFPSCFDTFEFVQTIENERKSKILSKVISERDIDKYESDLEDTRALNFISYMSFAVGNVEDAVKYNTLALTQSENNINAIISKAMYHLHKSEFAKSRAQCDLLDKLKKDTLEMFIAKAELSYVYGRVGMEMCKKAQNLFEEVLKERVNTNICISQYDICTLKFGLALSIKRQLNITGIHAENIDCLGNEAERCNQLLELCIDIIEMEGENLDKYKARAYVQVGETLNSLVLQNKTNLISEQNNAFFPKIHIKSYVKNCYNKGYELRKNDVFVLERFAKYCRLIGQVDRSIELCRHTLSIRETSICHHYLALALRKKLQLSTENTHNTWTKQNHQKRLEPQKKHNSSYKVNDVVDKQISVAANEFKASCGDGTSENDVADAKLSQRVEHLNLGAFVKPDADVLSGQLSKAHRGREILEANESSTSCSRHDPSFPFLAQIKSPEKPFPLQDDEIGEIIFHLEKAMELNENPAAMYDKALVLRCVGQCEQALDIFKLMFRKKCCSLINLANAYEQSALCLKDMIESDVNSECFKVENMTIDMKEYLLKSIEITCNLITKQPHLKKCWIAFPTLKSLLEENPKSKSNIRELGMLHRMVKDYDGAIMWFEQVLEMETHATDKASAHMDIVRDCLKVGKYAEAILHLNMVQCLQDCESIIDEHLYFEAHIEGGLQSFFKGEEEMASLRLKNALAYKRPEQAELFQQEWFDVFVLCDLKSETTGQNICKLLCKLGLKATLNDDSAAPGSLYMNCLTNAIKRSTHGVVILGNDMDDIRLIQMFTNVMKDAQTIHNYGNTVVVMENEHVQVDLMFTGFTSITYDQRLTESISEDQKPWLYELLWTLATGKKMLE